MNDIKNFIRTHIYEVKQFESSDDIALLKQGSVAAIGNKILNLLSRNDEYKKIPFTIGEDKNQKVYYTSKQEMRKFVEIELTCNTRNQKPTAEWVEKTTNTIISGLIKNKQNTLKDIQSQAKAVCENLKGEFDPKLNMMDQKTLASAYTNQCKDIFKGYEEDKTLKSWYFDDNSGELKCMLIVKVDVPYANGRVKAQSDVEKMLEKARITNFKVEGSGRPGDDDGKLQYSSSNGLWHVTCTVKKDQLNNQPFLKTEPTKLQPDEKIYDHILEKLGTVNKLPATIGHKTVGDMHLITFTLKKDVEDDYKVRNNIIQSIHKSCGVDPENVFLTSRKLDENEEGSSHSIKWVLTDRSWELFSQQIDTKT